MRTALGLIARSKHSLQHRFARRALILLYHRVADLESDPQLLHVTPRHFAEQMEIIRQYTRPVSLGELIQALAVNQLPRRAVVITFDDGYADNLHHAKPVLERFDIPATVFVTAGALGRAQEFWWDELERLLLQPGRIPEGLVLNVNGHTEHWDTSTAVDYPEGEYRRNLGWHIELSTDPSPRHALYRSLYQFLHSLDRSKRQKSLEELRFWLGVDPTGRSTHLPLSENELTHLSEGELIEIGAHTLTHPSLARLTLAEQRREVVGSKTRLEEISGFPVKSFAYPHGSFTEETLALLREEGFSCACSSDTEAVRRGAGLYQLPRLGVRDWDGDQFAGWLKHWLG